MTTLGIDTTIIKNAEVTLERDGNIYKKKSETILPIIEELLTDQLLTVYDITHIECAIGPGSFTGLKVGATVATTLSFLLNIPINNNPPGTIPELRYGKDLWGLPTSK